MATKNTSPSFVGNSAALRFALLPATLLYRLIARLRREGYERGWLKAVEVAAPVIVVGNVSVGGTGKTPVVEKFARASNRLNCRNARMKVSWTTSSASSATLRRPESRPATICARPRTRSSIPPWAHSPPCAKR